MNLCVCVCLYVFPCVCLSFCFICVWVPHSPGKNELLWECLAGRVGWAALMPHLVSDQYKKATDKNKCTSKPHTANRFPHGHVTLVTRVEEDEKELKVLELCLLWGLHPLSHPFPDKPPTSLILHYFHPHPSPWGISRILNASFDVFLCRNHFSWESSL